MFAPMKSCLLPKHSIAARLERLQCRRRTRTLFWILLCTVVLPVATHGQKNVSEPTAPKIYVGKASKYINEHVHIQGRTGKYVHDASRTTGVYTLTDDYGGTIRVRTSHGKPQIARTYDVFGTVFRDVGSRSLMLMEDKRVDVGGSSPPPPPPPPPGPGALPWVLGGAGAVLLLAAVGWVVADSKRKSAQRARRRSPVFPQAPAPVPAPLPMADDATAGATSAPAPAPISAEPWAAIRVAAGPAGVAPFDLVESSVTVGRDPGPGGFKLPDPDGKNAFSRKQFVISKAPNGAVLADQSSNGTIVDGQRVQSKTVSLRQASSIVMGPYTLEFLLNAASDATAAGASPSDSPTIAPVLKPPAEAATIAPTGMILKVIEGAEVDKGKVFPVHPAVTTIGRQEGQSVRLEDPSTSRTQAEISKDDEGYWITNKSRSFPLYVNGSDAGSGRTRLEAPVEIKFGETTLVFDKRP